MMKNIKKNSLLVLVFFTVTFVFVNVSNAQQPQFDVAYDSNISSVCDGSEKNFFIVYGGVSASGQWGNVLVFHVRDSVTLKGNPFPNELVLINGKEGTFADVSKDNFRRIEIFRNEAATDLLGSRGENGIVRISTKDFDESQNEITPISYVPLKFDESPAYNGAFIYDANTTIIEKFKEIAPYRTTLATFVVDDTELLETRYGLSNKASVLVSVTTDRKWTVRPENLMYGADLVFANNYKTTRTIGLIGGYAYRFVLNPFSYSMMPSIPDNGELSGTVIMNILSSDGRKIASSYDANTGVALHEFNFFCYNTASYILEFQYKDLENELSGLNVRVSYNFFQVLANNHDDVQSINPQIIEVYSDYRVRQGVISF